MARVVESVGRMPRASRRAAPDDHYGALVRAIVGQQLSVAAAATIHGRLLDEFDGVAPTPQQLLDFDPAALRAVGLSGAKTAYIRSLAEHVLSGELEVDRLEELGDEEVIAELTAVKGIGEWTAHMFLIFQLQRRDVLPVGDLGIRSAVRRWYELPELPGAEQIGEIAEPWRPHRSLASRYLWRSLAVTPV